MQATLEALAVLSVLAARTELLEAWWTIATPRAESAARIETDADVTASDEPDGRKGPPERATAGAHVRRLVAQILGPTLRAAVSPKADRDRFVTALARLSSPALLIVEAAKVRTTW